MAPTLTRSPVHNNMSPWVSSCTRLRRRIGSPFGLAKKTGVKPYNSLTCGQTPFRSKTSLTRNITVKTLCALLTTKTTAEDYSEERHRKRFPSPHCFIPFYRETPSWKPEPQCPVSAANSQQKQSRAPHSPPPDGNHMSWSNTEALTTPSCKWTPALEKQGNIWQKLSRNSRPLCVLGVLKVKKKRIKR